VAGKPGKPRLYAQIRAVLGAPHNPRTTIVYLEQVTLPLMRVVDVRIAAAQQRCLLRAD
jgi:hypothetical protein